MLEEILSKWPEFYDSIKNNIEIEKLETELERCYGTRQTETSTFKPTVEGIEPHDRKDLLKGLRLVSLENLKVVVLGNRPLLKSNGLAFGSYNKTKEFINISEELMSEYDTKKFNETSDEFTNRLSNEGVLFLDVVPTCLMKGKTNTHACIWSFFIESLIKYICTRGHLVWLIWSRPALNIITPIIGNKDNGGNKKTGDEKRNVSTNILLKCAYPLTTKTKSTYSKDEIYLKKFEHCNHFILCNNYLKQMYQEPIKWIK